MRQAPAYSITSVDHALRLATMLQLEGALTVTQAATRLGVARSTAHRLLAMLVYRDFAVQGDDKVYRAGPVMELSAHSRTLTAQLRAIALPHLHRLAEELDESVNLAIRTGATARFIASVECGQALRVTSREGMAFPAHRTSGGMVLLAELPPAEACRLVARDSVPGDDPPDDAVLARDLAVVRRDGFAVNDGRSERDVVAVGVPIHGPDGRALAGLSVSMPSTRYDPRRLPSLTSTLARAARALDADLRGWDVEWEALTRRGKLHQPTGQPGGEPLPV